MELDDSSMISTPPEKEPVMECSLLLTTLSEVTFKVSLTKFDRFEDLEDQVMDYLASVTDLKVFGCSIDFLQTATQTHLEDPIWDKLQQGMPGTRRWHGVYAEENAFAICPAMKWPPWLHMIPDMGYTPGLE